MRSTNYLLHTHIRIHAKETKRVLIHIKRYQIHAFMHACRPVCGYAGMSLCLTVSVRGYAHAQLVPGRAVQATKHWPNCNHVIQAVKQIIRHAWPVVRPATTKTRNLYSLFHSGGPGQKRDKAINGAKLFARGFMVSSSSQGASRVGCTEGCGGR